jgi:hypothetical protein
VFELIQVISDLHRVIEVLKVYGMSCQKFSPHPSGHHRPVQGNRSRRYFTFTQINGATVEDLDSNDL